MYDGNGNTIETNFFNPYGSLKTKDTYRYDKNEYKIEASRYNPDGSLNAKYTYQYELDKNLNWTKRIEFKDGVPVSICERELEYY